MKPPRPPSSAGNAAASIGGISSGLDSEAIIKHPDLVRRYLGAFGPAPARDIASWMGLNVTQMRHVLDAMELRTLSGGDGKPLLDLGQRHAQGAQPGQRIEGFHADHLRMRPHATGGTATGRKC